MDNLTIQGAASSLKIAFDIVKNLVELKSAVDVRPKIKELQDALIDAQSNMLSFQASYASMVEDVANLKQKIMSLETWSTEKQRYQLTKPWDGAVAYGLKESMSNGEPPHWICTSCYEDGRKSILNPQKEDSMVIYFCPKCHSKMRSPYRGGVEPQFVK